ncbi:MAG: ABC transporter substrate-binding protein, partial [Candidatus Omnitrophica bacterium]|nr:ABC transporter substrate-binding protein [Candidatus Omnitrophota bacterium]
MLKLTLCIIAALFIASEARCVEKPLKKVSFVSLWLPQSQFAGFYTAFEKGIYRKYGLDVTIINGGPDQPPFKLLEEGKVDFGVMWLSTGIEKRSQGIKVLNIAQILQRSGLMLVAKKSSGINDPLDMNNKKVGLWDADFEIQPRAFFKKYGLDVKVVPQSYSVNLFLRDGVDVASAMWYNEYHTIINSGYDPEELAAFFFYDYGLNSPEDGIYVLESTFNKD